MKAINEVKMLAAKKGLTLTYIAKYLSKNLRGETIRYTEMKIIAEALGTELTFNENI